MTNQDNPLLDNLPHDQPQPEQPLRENSVQQRRSRRNHLESAALAGHLLPELPPTLNGLKELATDLRWTWSHGADRLWLRVDRDLWQRTHNPYVCLQNVSHGHLRELAEDPEFCQQLHAINEERAAYLSRCGWFGEQYPNSAIGRIAFFSMEYGLGGALPFYAGGLGVLSGDMLKAASDLCVPMVGIGLLYHQGYFRQVLDANCRQQEINTSSDAATLPVSPVFTDAGWLRVAVDLPGRQLLLRVWQAEIGSVTLYLLDSDHPLNSPADRGITSQLYGGGEELRFLQELALAVGGWRTLRALALEIDVCHLNEGHAAFVVLARTVSLMRQTGLNFQQARWINRASTLFTTHTPVAAGFDSYDPAMIARYARPYLPQLQISLEELLALGRKDPADPSERFHMAWLALRNSLHVNGVSRIHGQVSRSLFASLYPRWPMAEIPVSHITNGIHVPSWDSPWADRLWTQAAGKERWRGGVEELSSAIKQLSDAELWNCRMQERADLVRQVRERHARRVRQRGGEPADVESAELVLDPNVLTLAYARRFTEYKRPHLLLKDRARLARLLNNAKHPVQLLIAGKAHSRDQAGKDLVHAWAQFAASPEAAGRVIFVEDYDIELAREMVQGVDVWINTPRRQREACGTSGMKVLVNGGLNLSVLDGWWDEAYSDQVGWAIDADGDRDDAIADELYRLLEQDIVPTFYRRNEAGIPVDWLTRMRASMATLAPLYSSNRMLREYIDKIYRDNATRYRRRLGDGGKLASDLQEWYETTRRFWRNLRWGERRQQLRDGGFTVEADLYLNGLKPEHVEVQLYADAVDGRPSECLLMQRSGATAGAIDSHVYRVTHTTTRPPEDFTPRVVAFHREALVPQENNLIFWWQPGD